jgi:hypothetical protein
MLSYGLYGIWGRPELIGPYYSAAALQARGEQLRSRDQWIHLNRSEYELRLRLEKTPEDQSLQWQLLDVLAKTWLYKGHFNEALLHWQAALGILSHQKFLNEADRQAQERIEHSMSLLSTFLDLSQRRAPESAEHLKRP